MENYAVESTAASTSSLIAALAIFVLFIICFWKIFTKAGEPGWKSIIPFYSTWTMLKMFWGGESVLLPFILLFIPIANVIVLITLYRRMARSFGKGVGYTIGMMFIPIVFFPLLAFGSNRYLGPNGGGNYA